MKRLILSLGAAAALAAPARAQQRVMLETLLDLELWKTDDSSRLLQRDSGAFAAEARLHVFGGWRPARGVELRAIALAEAGNAEAKRARWDLELLSLRLAPYGALSFEAGKILMPMGSFGARRFSNVNPVIGYPDLYPPQYPWGANLNGAAGALDFHAAVISLPNVNTRYTPVPSHRPRPVVGAGLALGPAFRLGITATHGSYLHKSETALDSGRTWSDYDQTLVAAEARLSIGYVETRGEAAWSRYEAPRNPAVRGFGAYVETKATLSPRVFLGARLEYFDYPFIRRFGNFWVANATKEMNGEVGVGYRFSAATLLKASLRRDHWPETPGPGAPPTPDGYALAVQFSWNWHPLEMIRY